MEVATLMGYEAASILDNGVIPTVEVSAEKVFTSELRQRIADLALDLLGPDGLLSHRSQTAPLAGKFERLYRAAAIDALRRGHQRGPARHHRPARPRNALVRTVARGMKAIPTEEQREFAASLRALLSVESPVESGACAG